MSEPKYGQPVHCDLDERGRMPADMQGETLMLAVRVGYPGSRVSDIYIGGSLVMVNNADIRLASLAHRDLCDTEGG